uniref:Orf66 protein n=1 Tax=Moineauvirus Sfi21 TaxID=64186 RepID=O21987_9CAUD|nr:orf66 [Moineauvirus Sfi21]
MLDRYHPSRFSKAFSNLSISCAYSLRCLLLLLKLRFLYELYLLFPYAIFTSFFLFSLHTFCPFFTT